MQEPETAESLRREVAALSARSAELEGAVANAERRTQRLERIIEVVPGAVWESEGSPGEPTYRMPYVSGEVERIFGYTREECLQSPSFWTSIVHPDDTPIILRDLAALAGTGGRLSEHRFVTKDGRDVWVETHITLRRDESGKVVGRSVVAPDVTERVLAERARADLLARSQELAHRLDNVIASVPGLVWEVRRRAGSPPEPVFLSDYLTTLTGYRPDEVLRDPALWNEATHPDDRARVALEIEHIYANGSGTLQQRWLTRDDRIIWVETHMRVIQDESGEPLGAYGVTMDVTARKLGEQERAQLKDQVIQAQEATLAELSTPLIPISSEVLVMPLIGSIDEGRAGRVIEALLYGISKARAKVAILDVTGVPSVDAQAADALLRAARSVTFLGAEVVISGIRPEVAAALVDLRTDLQEITVRGTLESAIAYAASRRSAR